MKVIINNTIANANIVKSIHRDFANVWFLLYFYQIFVVIKKTDVMVR